ncbi:HTTM domain-containing protein [Streptomyces sp. CA-210063]|uniref:HTTM domain-containing protein n=1 Tax=Streptomyces sp. CA-210063 TaxID=2801029 RepID=UPI00214B2350|nr:HTTM domain-containing protein [Streptomyces sp. CA-210063]UUU37093.1 HTTM domain-containing protein [Streptomyces sp. CA-210063]
MGRLASAIGNGITRVTDRALGPYQSAIIRIGFSATWLLFLLREFPHRRELYGPDGPWSWDLAQQLIANNDAFTVLMWSDSMVWFEIVYAVAILSTFLLLLGWRTRAASVLFMVGVLSLQNRSVFMGDGGDNVLHLMAIYLVFVRCAQVWSLDARRARRKRERLERDGSAPEDRVGPALWCVLGFALLVATFGGLVPGGLFGGWLTFFWGLWAVHGLWWAVGRVQSDVKPRVLLDIVGNLVHNAALVVIMAEACLIYAAAGWYKVQGSRWQDGTAAYYPFHLDYFSPWAALSDLMSSSGTMVMLVTYGTVIVQVAFPFTLFNRRVKNVLLAVMMTEHAVIAVVLGLPFFSLAMIAADAVFLPTPFLKRLGGLVTRGRDRVVRRVLPGRGRKLPGPSEPQQPPLPREKGPTEQAHVGFTA